MEKRSHLGMAGHYAAMSEFLLRGYNVAIPSVDVGDDVFVVDDRDGRLSRVQVKSSREPDDSAASAKVQYTLSRIQLRAAKQTELFFMFMLRWKQRWRFLLIPRTELELIRDDFESAPRERKRGPKPKSDAEAKGDALGFEVDWFENDAQGWGTSLVGFLDKWPADLPRITTGPGAVTPRK